MKNLCNLTLLCLLTTLIGHAQTQLINSSYLLDQSVTNYESIHLDDDVFDLHLIQKNQLSLDLGELGTYELQLDRKNMVSDKIAAKHGNNLASTYSGKVLNSAGYKYSLTVGEEFISGSIRGNDDIIFFEQKKNFEKNAASNEIVAYLAADQEIGTHSSCGSDHENHSIYSNDFVLRSSANICVTLEISLAADPSMVNKFGLLTLNKMQSILNDAMLFYDNEFNTFVQPSLVNTVICNSGVDCSNLSTSTNKILVMSAFAGKSVTSDFFPAVWDVATMWTAIDIFDFNRNVDIVGTATGEACIEYNGVNVCEAFEGANALQLATTQAHEIGHNLSATHDEFSNTFIMAEAIGDGATSWSLQSKNQINDFITNKTCLSCIEFSDLNFNNGCTSQILSNDSEILVTASVLNTGNITSNSSTIGYYASLDNNINPATDFLLAEETIESINPRNYQSKSKVINLNNQSIPTGTYYIGVYADNQFSISEITESNNSCIFGTYVITGNGTTSTTPVTCTPTASTVYEYIEELRISGHGTVRTGNNNGYYKHNGVVNLRTGTNFIWIEPGYPQGTSWDETYRVWIDFNNNGYFEQYEQVSYTNNNGGAWLIFDIGNQYLGRNFNMRVREEWTSQAGPYETDPCKWVEGEIEDYVIFVAAGKNDEPNLAQYDNTASSYSFPITPNPILSGGKASFNNSVFRGDPANSGNYSMQIISTDGKIMKTYNSFEISNRTASVDLPDLGPGLYFFSLSNSVNRMNTSGSFIVTE